MSDTRQIRTMRSEGQERLHTALANQHRHVPTLVLRPDQECSTLSEKQQITSGLAKIRQRMVDVALESLGPAYCRFRGQIRGGRIIRNLTKPKQIQHDDLTGYFPRHERAA